MDTPCSRRRLLSAGLIALAGCTSNYREGNEGREHENASGTEHEIRVNNDGFHPAVLELESGDRVVWHNTGTGVYTVTAKGDTLPPSAEYFASGGSGSETVARMLYPFVGGIHDGDSYSYTPTVPGEYEYYSIPQQARGYGMSGRLVVD